MLQDAVEAPLDQLDHCQSTLAQVYPKIPAVTEFGHILTAKRVKNCFCAPCRGHLLVEERKRRQPSRRVSSNAFSTNSLPTCGLRGCYVVYLTFRRSKKSLPRYLERRRKGYCRLGRCSRVGPQPLHEPRRPRSLFKRWEGGEGVGLDVAPRSVPRDAIVLDTTGDSSSAPHNPRSHWRAEAPRAPRSRISDPALGTP